MINNLMLLLRAAMLLALFVIGPLFSVLFVVTAMFAQDNSASPWAALVITIPLALLFFYVKKSNFLKPASGEAWSLSSVLNKKHNLGQLGKEVGSAAASAAGYAAQAAKEGVKHAQASIEEERLRRTEQRAEMLAIVQSFQSSSSETSCRIVGIGCVMTVYRNKVSIEPKGVWGFLLRGIKGVKSIPFDSITATQFKAASFPLRGYLQLSILGGTENRRGIVSATGDENTFLFDGPENNELIEAVRTHIENNIAHARGRPSTSSNQPSSMTDELQKLIEMKNGGMLSDDEFRKAKAKLIADAN